MDLAMINWVILGIHVDKKDNNIIPSHSIKRQTSISECKVWEKKTVLV